MASVDRRTHSFRRVLRINDQHFKAWCKLCDGDTARAQKRARTFDSWSAVLDWWRAHESDGRHMKLTEPEILRRRRVRLEEHDERAALLATIYGK